jgi:hypothetical protein
MYRLSTSTSLEICTRTLASPCAESPLCPSPVRTSSTTSMRHESCQSAFVGRHLFFDVVIGRVRLHVMVIFFLIWVPPFIVLPNSQRNAFIKHGGQAVHKRHSCQNTLHALPSKLAFNFSLDWLDANMSHEQYPTRYTSCNSKQCLNMESLQASCIAQS